MKKITIPFELRADVKAGEVVNLRATDGALQPVGEPMAMGVDDVGAVMALGRGAYLCVETDGQTLVVVDREGRVHRPGTAGGAVVGVCRADESSWWVMTDVGPELLQPAADGSPFELLGPPPGFGAVALRGVDGGRFSATVASSRLAGSYPRGNGALTATDAQTMGEALMAAYEAVGNSASAAGGLIQPVMAAWRLVDKSGQELFRSVPQWLGPEEGFSMTGSMTTEVNAADGNYCQVSAFGISARAWKPTVVVDLTAVVQKWRARCTRLEILATRPIEFVEKGAATEASMYASATTGDATLRVFMPGASRGYTTDTMRLRGLLTQALQRFNSEAEIVAVVNNPFGSATSGAKTLRFHYSGVKPLAGALPPELDLPNRFAASASYESGSVTVHGNVTAIGCAGAAVGHIAVAVADNECRQQTVVTLDDGSTLVTLTPGEIPAPRTLPPIIVCPAANAVRLSLQGGNEAMELALEPSACGRWTYWQAPGFAPVDWTPSARPWAVVAPTARPREFPSAIVCASAQTPLNLRSFHSVCRGDIMKITRAVGASGGWNYGRQHLMVWATDGVYALSVERTLTAAGSSMIYDVGVGRPDAVTTAADTAYAALTDGRLIRLSATKVTDIALPVRAQAVGWCDTRRELWVIDSAGTPCVVTASGGIYFRKPGKVRTLAGKFSRSAP